MINRSVPSVIVPLDSEGWLSILGLKEDERDYLVFPIPEEHLNILVRNDFFETINSALHCWIDACEEAAFYDPVQINQLIQYLEGDNFSSFIRKRGTELEQKRAVYYRDKICLMAKKALRLQTPILFHF